MLRNAAVLLALALSACFSKAVVVDHTSLGEFSRITPARAAGVRTWNVLFGHRSVGRIIMREMLHLARDNPTLHLTIVPPHNACCNPAPHAAASAEQFKRHGPMFGHMTVTEPNRFFDSLNASAAFIDIAIFSYEYNSIYGSITAERLFRAYREKVQAFRHAHPGVVIIHTSMALRTEPDRFNAERTTYRELILAEYGTAKGEYILDLAALESEWGGRLTTFEHEGRTCLRMSPHGTYDTGHPNKAMGRKLAKAFWVMLAKVAEDLEQRHRAQ
jgi:hypothetical protein